MGDLTYTDLVDEVGVATGAKRSDIHPRIRRYLNMSQRRIARAHRWEELKHVFEYTMSYQGTPSMDKVVALPPNVRDLHSIRLISSDGRSRRLVHVPYPQWDRIVPEPEFFDRRIPVWFTYYGRTLEVYPIPEQTYLLRARMDLWPAPFTGDAEQVSMLEGKDDVIVHMAASFAWRSVGDHDKSKEYFAIASRMLEEGIKDQNEKPAANIQPAFETIDQPAGEYWRNPWIRRVR